MKRTGYVSDDAMEKHCLTTNHPENPNRIKVPIQMLQQEGLLGKCTQVKSRSATDTELRLVHDQNHINAVKMYTADQQYNVCKLPETSKTYTNDFTYESAAVAVGSLLCLVDAVYEEKTIDNGIAIIRPPGHHAEQNESCGFCFFNNVAIATHYAQQRYNVGKVLIVDWDIHHGNGIQHIFYDDPTVLYISLHRFDNGDYFPQLKEANFNFTGEGQGEGYNVNIPWNKDMMGDAEYKAAFQEIVLPIARQFNPELIIVASGFDAVDADMLGEYVVTPPMFGFMTKQLMTVMSSPRILLSLEGGYNSTAIGTSLAHCLRVLLGEQSPSIDSLQQPEQEVAIKRIDTPRKGPCKRAQKTISDVRQVQSKYWKLDC